MHTLRLKIKYSYLKCNTRNKFRNFLERVEIAERGKDAPLFPCFLLNGECRVIYLFVVIRDPGHTERSNLAEAR